MKKLFPQISTASGPTKKWEVLIAINHSVASQLHEVIKDGMGRYIILICDLNYVLGDLSICTLSIALNYLFYNL